MLTESLPNITLAIPEELRKKMKRHSEMKRIYWAKSEAKIFEALELENKALAQRVAQLETLVVDIAQKARTASRRYRKAREQVKKLVDSYHIVAGGEQPEDKDTRTPNKLRP